MPQQDSAQQPIYHYTGAAGLRGILQSKHIWATHTDFMNDSAEMEFACEQIKLSLREKIGLVTNLGVRDERDKLALFFMREFAESLDKTISGNVYVSSFSAEGDSLAQWRAYAPAGYAIEFDKSDFFGPCRQDRGGGVDTAPSGSPHTHWEKIAYGRDAASLAKSLVTKAYDYLLSNTPAGNSGVHVNQLMVDLFGNELPLMKHSSFSVEREERLIVDRCAEPVLFRVADQTMGPIPYVEVPFHLNSIKRIVVGPGPNKELRARSAQILLDKIFGENSWRKKVDISTSPARS